MGKNASQLWQKEYQAKGIPSSFRKDPTKVLVSFVNFLRSREIQRGTALDLGCGKGRNAFYLAQLGYQVICLDFVKENIQAIHQKAQQSSLTIQAYCQDITMPWPVTSQQCDIAIDIFCYKHLPNKEAQKRYRHYLAAALKEKGYYLLSLASVKDGFYGPLLSTSPDPSSKLVIDPYSQIASYLYTQEELIQEFSDTMEVIHIHTTSSISPMHGKEYSREVITAIFQRK